MSDNPKANSQKQTKRNPDSVIQIARQLLPKNGWTRQELAQVRDRIVAFWEREPETGFEVSIMLRARGASANSHLRLLDQKFANEKLRVGGRNTPRSQNWFLAVIENDFTPGHLPEPPVL